MKLLSETAIAAINESIPCKNRLASYATPKVRSVGTIERWLREAKTKTKDCGFQLTTETATQIIHEETGLPYEQILTQENKS